jgi:hypothetical protein
LGVHESEASSDVLLRKYAARHVESLRLDAERYMNARLLAVARSICALNGSRRLLAGAPKNGLHIAVDASSSSTKYGALDVPAEYFWSPLSGYIFRKPGAWTMVLNQWSYKASATCSVAAIVTCCPEGGARVTGVATCNLNYLLSDKFDNPLDIGGWDATGNNLGGNPYVFVGTWKDRWRFPFELGPSDCGCADEARDPYRGG